MPHSEHSMNKEWSLYNGHVVFNWHTSLFTWYGETMSDNCCIALDKGNILQLLSNLTITQESALRYQCLLDHDPSPYAADEYNRHLPMIHMYTRTCCLQGQDIIRAFITTCNRKVGMYMQSFRFIDDKNMWTLSDKIPLDLAEQLDMLIRFVNKCL